MPATSANLGCAFDCAALALSLYLDLHVTRREDDARHVSYRGVTPERVPVDESNLILRIISQALEGWHLKRGFDLEIENQIPIGVGLGSSAAAIIGALAACLWLCDKVLPDQELVSLAASLEGHPDNVAAAWHGGFTVALEDQGRISTYSCPVPDSLHLALIVPDYALSTEKARGVLPAEYPRSDAVHNLQRAVRLTAEFFAGRAQLNTSLFNDRWHQPYRTPLVPGLERALQLTHPDLLGICLSGAGPSVLAFVRSRTPDVGELVHATLREAGVESKVHYLSADNLGAKSWRLRE